MLHTFEHISRHAGRSISKTSRRSFSVSREVAYTYCFWYPHRESLFNQVSMEDTLRNHRTRLFVARLPPPCYDLHFVSCAEESHHVGTICSAVEATVDSLESGITSFKCSKCRAPVD
ncbi:hypothetical protein AVEN_270505-1 [Araneus ventricosus]|uniref:Uncharacterized protein n=1 Tax=Araneus ventricosus TaxID=182803 RepID=A0A4Y2B5A6_ARAVE|nr:hypothetical protein AVEN_270505-1 [Araneus ventricosus]